MLSLFKSMMKHLCFSLLLLNVHARTHNEASGDAASIRFATLDSMVRFNAYNAELPSHSTSTSSPTDGVVTLSVAGRESESIQLLLRLAPSATLNTTATIRLVATYGLQIALLSTVVLHCFGWCIKKMCLFFIFFPIDSGSALFL